MIALLRAAGPYSARSRTNQGAATSAAPNSSISTAAARRPRAESHQTRAASSATAGISGRMYCGRFDCEREKKTNGTAIQSARKTVALSFFQRDASTTALHGNAPNSRYGTKYHGGPVRLSAFV